MTWRDGARSRLSLMRGGRAVNLRIPNSPAEPDDRKAHEGEHDRDADTRQRGEESERAAGESGQGESDNGQDGNAAARERAGTGGEAEDGRQRSRDARRTRCLGAAPAGFALALPVRTEREVRPEPQRGEKGAAHRRDGDDEPP